MIIFSLSKKEEAKFLYKMTNVQQLLICIGIKRISEISQISPKQNFVCHFEPMIQQTEIIVDIKILGQSHFWNPLSSHKAIHHIPTYTHIHPSISLAICLYTHHFACPATQALTHPFMIPMTYTVTYPSIHLLKHPAKLFIHSPPTEYMHLFILPFLYYLLIQRHGNKLKTK